MRARRESLGLDCPVVHEIDVDKEWTLPPLAPGRCGISHQLARTARCEE